MTSSLRNSLHRRNHKERSQLAHRAKYGILEKHKDYVLRARDYHAKQDHITRLRQKAANRNKDEFYFAMKNEKTVGGVHVKERGNVALPMDMAKLLKTQDEGYIRTTKAVGVKKIDRIKRQLTDMADLIPTTAGDLDDDGSLTEAELDTLRAAGVVASPSALKRKQHRVSPRHIVFAESAVEAQQLLEKSTSVNQATDNVTPSGPSAGADLGWRTNESGSSKRRRRRPSASEDVDNTEGEKDIQHRKHLLKELAARLDRDTQLSYALRELEMQRLLAGKGGRRKIQGAELVEDEERDSADSDDDTPHQQKSNPSVYKPRVYKWKVERKR